MKIKFLISIVFTSLIPTTFADITCTDDLRPDGPYTKINLVQSKTTNKYKLLHIESTTNQVVSKSTSDTKVLLSKLSCNIKDLTVYCINPDNHVLNIYDTDKKALYSVSQEKIEQEKEIEVLVSYYGRQLSFKFDRHKCQVSN